MKEIDPEPIIRTMAIENIEACGYTVDEISCMDIVYTRDGDGGVVAQVNMLIIPKDLKIEINFLGLEGDKEPYSNL